jgi:hypothetical protein
MYNAVVRGQTANENAAIDESVFALDSDRLIGMVNGTMAIEGMPLTEADKERLRTVIRNEVTADEMVSRLVNKHKRNANAGQVYVK